MQKAEVSYVSIEDLLEVLALPENTHAAFEWTTGLMRVNCNSEDFYSILEKKDTRWENFFDCIVHETYHMYQICRSGFLYTLVTQIANELWEILGSYQYMISDVFSSPYTLSASLNKLVSILSFKDNEIDIISIIEGSAFLAHNKIRRSQLSPEKYSNILRFRENTIYSKTYRYTETIFGHKAFYLLPTLSFCSLQYSNPVTVFCSLIKHLEKLSSKIEDTNFKEIIYEAIPAVILDIEEAYDIYKDPFSEEMEDSVDAHPFYSSTFKQIKHDFTQEKVEDILCNPNPTCEDFFLEIMRPVLFNDGVMILPKCSNEFFSDDHELANGMSLFAGLSFKFLTNHNVLQLFSP